MQIVFLNTFEKQGEDGGINTAQLSICEDQGIWSVLWLEDKGAAEGHSEPERWFEGMSWEEMITSFRYGVAKMMGQGYSPIVSSMLEDGRSTGGSLLSMLQCYGELHANEELFQSLREWRRKVAAVEKKSAYLIATNRMLWMISSFVPQSNEELMQIPGWGRTKHDAHGAAILAITAEVERTTVFPLDWVPRMLDHDQYTAWLYKQKENKYKGQMDRLQEKKRMLTILQQSGNLDQLQTELSMTRRELLLRIEQLEEEGYDLEPFIERELTIVPEEEQQQIWDALTKVGHRYLKPVLQHVYGENATSDSDKPIELLYERLRLMRMRYRRNSGDKAV